MVKPLKLNLERNIHDHFGCKLVLKIDKAHFLNLVKREVKINAFL